MDLANVAKLLQFGDAFPHDGYFSGAVVDFLDGDWAGSASVNDTFIILDGNEQSLVVEDGPILYNESADFGLDVRLEMRQVKFFAQFLPVDGLDICRCESRVDIVEWWSRMLSFAENRATIDIAQEGIKFVRLIWKTAIVIEDVIGSLPLLGLSRDADGRWLVRGLWR